VKLISYVLPSSLYANPVKCCIGDKMIGLASDAYIQQRLDLRLDRVFYSYLHFSDLPLAAGELIPKNVDRVFDFGCGA
jgi:hypothetical protein